MVLGFILFFLAGLGFGYAAPGGWKFAPFFFPVALALGAFVQDGFQGEIFLRLLIALLITGLGIFLGILIDERSREGGETAQAG
jgi:hypothetical protein